MFHCSNRLECYCTDWLELCIICNGIIINTLILNNENVRRSGKKTPLKWLNGSGCRAQKSHALEWQNIDKITSQVIDSAGAKQRIESALTVSCDYWFYPICDLLRVGMISMKMNSDSHAVLFNVEPWLHLRLPCAIYHAFFIFVPTNTART